MVIKLAPELEAALEESARQQGTTPESLAVSVLQQRFLRPVAQDEWERKLMSLASDCGASLSNAALSSEGLYE
jgi:hypothetical protein